MDARLSRGRDLRNETIINVAALLCEPLGGARLYRLDLESIALDSDLTARRVGGEIRLTHLHEEILASVTISGVAELLCDRCLDTYDQSFTAEFSEIYRQTVDVRTGSGVVSKLIPDDTEVFAIGENHELDLAEALRQWVLLSFPMRPDCGLDCPGPDLIEVGEPSRVDERFAALSRLLEDNPS
ncbi:MAG: DUF177 domain-containing protein [Chloroflexota bacterium]|nr:DUF177 domain-containing protein [Chloroflexota bacterium]